MLIVKNSSERIEELIIELEESIGYELPFDYKKFLKKYNGGETPNTSIKSKEASTSLRFFYGLGDVKNSFSKVTCIKVNSKTMLPIAEDTFGNVFAIGLEGDDKVYFVDHEKENGIILVGDTFLGFVNKCKSEEINPLSRRTPKEREEALIKCGKGGNITEGLRKMWQAEYEKYIKLCQEEVVI